MRDLIIARLEELRKLHDNFNPKLMRWNGVEVNDIPVGKVDFSTLDDEELLETFEIIIRESCG